MLGAFLFPAAMMIIAYVGCVLLGPADPKRVRAGAARRVPRRTRAAEANVPPEDYPNEVLGPAGR